MKRKRNHKEKKIKKGKPNRAQSVSAHFALIHHATHFLGASVTDVAGPRADWSARVRLTEVFARHVGPACLAPGSRATWGRGDAV
jgi:hypothetical protein